MATKHIRPRMGQLIICPNCEEPRHFGYGPCSNCKHQPNAAAVDLVRKVGILIDSETGLIVESDPKIRL